MRNIDGRSGTQSTLLPEWRDDSAMGDFVHLGEFLVDELDPVPLGSTESHWLNPA